MTLRGDTLFRRVTAIGSMVSLFAVCACRRNVEDVRGDLLSSDTVVLKNLTEDVILHIRRSNDIVEAGAPTELEVDVEADAPRIYALDFSAWMPRHNHGTNSEPVVENMAPGSFRIRNVTFHMPGEWELRFNLKSGSETEQLRYAINVP